MAAQFEWRMNLVRLRTRSDRSFLRANKNACGNEGRLSAPALNWMRLVAGAERFVR